MKKAKKTLLLSLAIPMMALSWTSCSPDKDKDQNDFPEPSGEENVITGTIDSEILLTADRIWKLKGYVYVSSTGALRIEPGTIIQSDIVEKGAIIVEPGGKLWAEGTQEKPIVFTSGLPKGQRRPGDWGGIILLGKAPTNRTTPPTMEGGVNRTYGGNDPQDNSGALVYVRIEFAGIAASPGSEINGLTLGGVGTGTRIENVMVSYGNDDGFEFFGGTVNAKNLIAFACLDDDYDFDFGYQGTIERAIALKHPQFSDAGDASNGIEADNDGSGTDAQPKTRPVLRHFTLIGPNKESNLTHHLANRWRRGAEFSLENSILMGFPKGGFSMESASTAEAFKSGRSVLRNNLIHGFNGTAFVAGSGTGMTAQEIEAIALQEGNQILHDISQTGLVNPFDLENPDFSPQPGSLEAQMGIGAITDHDWTKGWTNWTPNETDYE